MDGKHKTETKEKLVEREDELFSDELPSDFYDEFLGFSTFQESYHKKMEESLISIDLGYKKGKSNKWLLKKLRGLTTILHAENYSLRETIRVLEHQIKDLKKELEDHDSRNHTKEEMYNALWHSVNQVMKM